MTNNKIEYKFTAKVHHYSVSADMVGWIIVLLPQEMANEIREQLKWQEEGWGRMKVSAKIGNSEWKTSIWFDTKHETYILPLKAEIRKKEKIEIDKEVEVIIGV